VVFAKLDFIVVDGVIKVINNITIFQLVEVLDAVDCDRENLAS